MYELEYYRREGNEKHNTDKAEELAAKQCRKERPQRRKPHAAANHMRVDELIFRELHRLIDDQAQQRLLRLGKQRQQYADRAGGQRADVGNKGEGRRQRGGQPRVGNAAQGEREKDHRAEDHDLHALPGQETGVGGVRQARDAADPIGLSLAQVGVEESAALFSKAAPVEQHIKHDDDGKGDVGHRRDCGTGKIHHRVDQRAGAGERLFQHRFPIERGDAIGELACIHAVIREKARPVRPVLPDQCADALERRGKLRQRQNAQQYHDDDHAQKRQQQAEKVNVFFLCLWHQARQTSCDALHRHTEDKRHQ